MISLHLAFLQHAAAVGVAPGAGSGPAQAGAPLEPTGQLFRFLFTAIPQPVQIAAILIGGAVAVIAAWQVWTHRVRLVNWLTARSRPQKAALAGAVGLAGLVAAGSGMYGYNFMMHNNDFCQSCHIMDTAWNRFQVSVHKQLTCHTCHRQPMIASTKELFLWVFERRMAIPTHDKVPTAVCSECHVQSAVDTSRSNVMLTAGHRLHLMSDSSALKNVQCTTCHGHDFHTFTPNNATCAQSGCHTGIRVELGGMSKVGMLHCTTCHAFRTRVDTAGGEAAAKRGVTPRALNCGACHEMSERMRDWDLAADPHKGTCGMCHNPHTQSTPREAFKTCASAQCHASADTLTSLHRGLGKHSIDNCGACHQAHSWKVKGSDCLSCHKTIFGDKPKATPPRPSPPSRRGHAGSAGSVGAGGPHGPAASAGNALAGGVMRDVALRTSQPVRARRRSPRRTGWRGVVLAVAWQSGAQAAGQSGQGTQPPRPPALDTGFLHSRHRPLACTECHNPSSAHGALRFTRPDGCLGCHHGPQQTRTCTTCHVVDSIGPFERSLTFHVSTRAEPQTRTVTFPHARHAGARACNSCHGTDNRRTFVAQCTDCHTDHHAAARDCASCHPTARASHTRDAHNGCAACHAPDRLPPDLRARPVCITCHQDRRTHYAGRECVACHVMPESPAHKESSR